jgi:hypothetical protein
MNRAILSAQDQTWSIYNFLSSDPLEVIKLQEDCFRTLHSSDDKCLKEPHSKHGTDPRTRYKQIHSGNYNSCQYDKELFYDLKSYKDADDIIENLKDLKIDDKLIEKDNLIIEKKEEIKSEEKKEEIIEIEKEKEIKSEEKKEEIIEIKKKSLKEKFKINSTLIESKINK